MNSRETPANTNIRIFFNCITTPSYTDVKKTGPLHHTVMMIGRTCR